MQRLVVTTALLVVLGTTGCSRSQMLDLAMASAARPLPSWKGSRVGTYELLGGDLHTHVLPPDTSSHVSRELPETFRLARDEGLDFVVLTPHMPSRFFLDPKKREWVLATHRMLRVHAQALETTPSAETSRAPMLIPGMEYTDAHFGHVGLSFADVGSVLDDVSVEAARRRPERFFESWQAHGGLATINHPVLRPLRRSPIEDLRYDLSWRGFAPADRAHATAVFPEIAWLSEHAGAIETWNTTVGHLRDQYFVGDRDVSMREATHLLDRLSRTQERRVTPVGGSDSHGSWLRPTTWVLATERTPAGVRDAIVHGRTCVRAPEACSLEVQTSDGSIHGVGASITTAPPPAPRRIDVRARGGHATYFVNGEIAATGDDGERLTIDLPSRCALVRVVVGESASAPVYVDCPWATAGSSHPLVE